MGHQIIRQPDGKYAVWSTVVDNFVLIDAEPSDIVDAWVEQERERLEASVARTMQALAQGGKPYAQFTMSWDEAIQTIKAVHGVDETLESLREQCAE